MDPIPKTYDNCIHREVCDYQDVPCEPDICPCYEHNKFQYFRGYFLGLIEMLSCFKEAGIITSKTADKIIKKIQEGEYLK